MADRRREGFCLDRALLFLCPLETFQLLLDLLRGVRHVDRHDWLALEVLTFDLDRKELVRHLLTCTSFGLFYLVIAQTRLR